MEFNHFIMPRNLGLYKFAISLEIRTKFNSRKLDNIYLTGHIFTLVWSLRVWPVAQTIKSPSKWTPPVGLSKWQ